MHSDQIARSTKTLSTRAERHLRLLLGTEASLPAVQGGPWFGLLVPAGTPAAAVEWLNAQSNKIFSAREAQIPFDFKVHFLEYHWAVNHRK
jgi:hypothetical protein